VRTRFGSKRKKITGGWRQLHNEELTYSPLNNRRLNSRSMRWAGHVARMGAKTNAYKLCIGNPEGVYIDWRLQYMGS
jgi:hypothetical protein